MILEAKNIIKKFKETIVLDSVSLNIEESEILSVQGSSGSGKTTLLNILGLLDKPCSGTIDYNNNLKYNTFTSTERINTIGYIFQFHHLLSEFKIIDNLIIPQLLAGKKHSEAINHAKELLKLLNLSDISDRYSNEISGGECQRVAVLRGIINNPSIVFADEPTGNLDTENSSIIIKLLDDLRKEFGISFIIATHDSQVTKISDNSLYITNGRIK